MSPVSTQPVTTQPTAAGVSPHVNGTQLAAAGSFSGIAGQPPPPPGYNPGQSQAPPPAGFQGAYLEAVSQAAGGVLGDNLAPKEVCMQNYVLTRPQHMHSEAGLQYVVLSVSS